MPQPPRITFSSGGAPPGTYTNDVNISHTPWDFVLTFSQLIASPPNELPPDSGPQPASEFTKHTVGRFAMSPQHAKALLAALATNVASYEAIFGPIPDVAALAAQRARDATDTPAESGDEGVDS